MSRAHGRSRAIADLAIPVPRTWPFACTSVKPVNSLPAGSNFLQDPLRQTAGRANSNSLSDGMPEHAWQRDSECTRAHTMEASALARRGNRRTLSVKHAHGRRALTKSYCTSGEMPSPLEHAQKPHVARNTRLARFNPHLWEERVVTSPLLLNSVQDCWRKSIAESPRDLHTRYSCLETASTSQNGEVRRRSADCGGVVLLSIKIAGPACCFPFPSRESIQRAGLSGNWLSLASFRSGPLLLVDSVPDDRLMGGYCLSRHR